MQQVYRYRDISAFLCVCTHENVRDSATCLPNPGTAKRHDSMEGGGRERLEHVLEVELRRDDCMEAGGSECREHILEQQPRVESGRL